MTTVTTTELFHYHIDGCAQCRRHPFDLCTKGEALLLGSTVDRAGMEAMALQAVVQILHEDLEKFQASKTQYHANAVRQWAMDASHRARALFPQLYPKPFHP